MREATVSALTDVDVLVMPQAEMGQGGRPDMQTLLASIGSSGNANLQAGVARRLPA